MSKAIEVPMNEAMVEAVEGALNAFKSSPAEPKPFDAYFSIEHQGMIAAKYRQKYSELEQAAHKAEWPEFAGNHFTLYVLAETLLEAKKAVFSANRTIFAYALHKSTR